MIQTILLYTKYHNVNSRGNPFTFFRSMAKADDLSRVKQQNRVHLSVMASIRNCYEMLDKREEQSLWD